MISIRNQVAVTAVRGQPQKVGGIMLQYQNIISGMTLEQKALMMSGQDTWRTKDFKEHGIPAMFLSDGPHGLRKQAGAGDHLGLNASLPATCFPTAATMANSWDVELGEQLGRCLGEEAADLGVNVVLGPGLNMKRSPLCGRNFEYFSEDPYLAGKMAAAYIRGIQSQGIAACPKHFAANSQEERRMAMDAVVDERTFRELYTTGFEIAVKEGGAKAIMTAYNEINGVYANESEHLLGDILYGEWAYEGMVVSDWGGSNDHVEGVRQGSHLEMPSTGKMGAKQIVRAVEEGRLDEALLDQRVDELLRIVFATHDATEQNKGHKFDIEAHHAFARKAAAESIVLLKNERHILPLNTTDRVAVIGDFGKTPRYQGAGSSLVNPTKEVESICDMIHYYDINYLDYARGYVRNKPANAKLQQEAVALAKEADVVLLCVGLDEISESEGLDRVHMEMPKAQVELIEAVAAVNPHVVVLMSAGSSVTMPWEKDVAAIVHGYLGGQAGASAMLDVLTGKVCPSGKLSETYAFSLSDVPSTPYYPSPERSSEYREGLYMGYRYFDTRNVAVAYPFGFGLSYTTFSYSNLSVDEEGAHFTVSNTGEVDGAEVAQMYIGHNRSQLFGPKKELKGFVKVFLKAGESRQVTIPFDDKSFRYYNVATDQWEIEGGTYQVYIGASVADIRLREEIERQGSGAPIPYTAKQLPSYYSGDVSAVSDEEYQMLYGRPLPPAKWDTTGKLGVNDAICQMYYAKSLLARFICWILRSIKKASEKKGTPNLNILFIYNMPFRGLSKMTGGAMNEGMIDGLVEIVNGRGLIGLGHLIAAIFKG